MMSACEREYRLGLGKIKAKAKAMNVYIVSKVVTTLPYFSFFSRSMFYKTPLLMLLMVNCK